MTDQPINAPPATPAGTELEMLHAIVHAHTILEGIDGCACKYCGRWADLRDSLPEVAYETMQRNAVAATPTAGLAVCPKCDDWHSGECPKSVAPSAGAATPTTEPLTAEQRATGFAQARRIITNAAGYHFGGELTPFDPHFKALALEALVESQQEVARLREAMSNAEKQLTFGSSLDARTILRAALTGEQP